MESGNVKNTYNPMSEGLLGFFVKMAVWYHFGFTGLALFNKITHQELSKSDAVVMLQGDRFDHVKEPQDLYKKNVAPKIIIAGNNELIGRGKRNDENDVHLLELKKELADNGVPESAIMVEDRSLNTKDQAINVIKLAKENHWKKIIVVTSLYHTLRTYLTFAKSSNDQGWQGVIIMQPAKLPWGRLASGRSKTAWQMLLVELKKIKKYKKDIVNIGEGLNYFNTHI